MMTIEKSAIEQFTTAIESAGLPAPHEVVDDGLLHRFSTNGKPKDDSGWYVLHGDGMAAGSFGDFRQGITQNWCIKSADTMTDGERQAHRDRIKTMQAAREADLVLRQTRAAHEAARRWAEALPCTGHPYLARKGIQPHGVKTEGDNLLIPVYDSTRQIVSLQTITQDGSKFFMSDGRVKGCYFSIGKPTDNMVIAEGFATGASINEATGGAVAVAFNAGNLAKCAQPPTK